MEGVAGHDLEQVAPGEPVPGALDDASVRARLGATRDVANGLRAGTGWGRRRLARQSPRRHPRHGEVVPVADGSLALAVEHVELVRQVQDQVALLAGPLMTRLDRFETHLHEVQQENDQ